VIRFIACGLLVLLAFAALPATPASAEARFSVQVERRSFSIQGHSVSVEVYRPRGAVKTPAVLLLHGAGGIGSGWLLYPQARLIATRGISVFVVDYFAGMRGRKATKSAAHRYAEREAVIAEAIAFAARQTYIDPGKIGLYGISLGGFQALGLATRDTRIGAVASMFGAMSQHIALDSVGRMPPVLLLHGARDRVVPLRRAFEVGRMLDRLGTPYEMKVYTELGHAFSQRARDDAAERAADFFDRHLNGRGRPHS